MDSYDMLFQHNPSPNDVSAFSQAGFLFNTHEHLQHQQAQGLYVLSAVNTRTRQADARCAFFVRSGLATSPLAAPFGSIECTQPFPAQSLDAFIRTLCGVARSVGATRLRLVSYPVCYAPVMAEYVAQQLGVYGFKTVETNHTYFLPVSDAPADFNPVPAEKRRIGRCLRAGFQFRQWASADAGEAIHFLQKTRRQKGYALTISPERLADLFVKFPEQCLIFVVMDGGNVAALTITIRVRHDILYSFQPASTPIYHSFSPMTLLIDGLYTYCQQQRISVLDLGLSLNDNRQPKPGLIRFKQNMGAQESPKRVFELAL